MRKIKKTLISTQNIIATIVVVCLIGFAGCDGGSSGDDSTPSTPSTSTVIYDGSWHHIGDEYRSDYIVKSPEGTSKNYSFSVEKTPQSLALEIELSDVDLIGVHISINGQNVASFAGTSGFKTANVPVNVINLNNNILTVYSGNQGSQIEDFEYRSLKLTVSY